MESKNADEPEQKYILHEKSSGSLFRASATFLEMTTGYTTDDRSIWAKSGHLMQNADDLCDVDREANIDFIKRRRNQNLNELRETVSLPQYLPLRITEFLIREDFV
ncbi:MAG: hypothetical protein ABEJ02_03275 [Candidatus Paceibacteria bacterium]